MIQTLFPGHYSIRLATSQDYVAFFDKEIEFRRAMRYPPIIAMVNVVVRGKTYDDAMERGGRTGETRPENSRSRREDSWCSVPRRRR